MVCDVLNNVPEQITFFFAKVSGLSSFVSFRFEGALFSVRVKIKLKLCLIN